jgi:hypothetical protein
MSIDDYSTMSTDELWLFHQQIVKVLKARLLERKQQLDAQLAALPRSTSAGSERARVGPDQLPIRDTRRKMAKERIKEDAN